jgi:polyphosphate kinase 2 (PPK2 family)
VGTILCDALQARLRVSAKSRGARAAASRTTVATSGAAPPVPPASILAHVDLTQRLSEARYRQTLVAEQTRLSQLAWAAHQQKRSMVTLFEGWDAAGKGSAIRRVTWALDPRLYRVVGVAAPTDEERAQHYLWRVWRHLPRAGFGTIFDRSWYGRVLVERVEGLTSPADWNRAYQEINEFEEQLAGHGIVINKFWLHISKDEQLRRFKERRRIVYKRHKITAEDWRNRRRWAAYEAAVNDMIARCSTEFAPWTLVAGNDKKFARIQILKTMADRLENVL